MRFAVLLVLAFALWAPPTHAQIPSQFEPGRAVQSREDLSRLLGQLEAALASPVYSEAVKSAIRADAERIRGRLEHGDFQIGDRVAIDIVGEENMPDTLPVVAGPSITIPTLGDISLAGVLRSEVQAHLTEEVRRYIKDPTVMATALMRISIQGGVPNPGFFVLSTDMLLTEALMYAGGLPGDTDMAEITIERAGTEILGGDPLVDAIRQGLTLDQLNLQAGDQIQVPLPASTGQSIMSSLARFGLIIATSVLFGIRVF